jgi:hypothetical protein
MRSESYFYNCSEPYLESISLNLHAEILDVIEKLPKRLTQSEINQDLFWILTNGGWSYDTVPASIQKCATEDLTIGKLTRSEIKQQNNRDLCRTTTTIEARWHADFAKLFQGKLVQIEAQFGKVESMFKDFCGFKIGRYERRLALGIEIVMCEPSKYFFHRRPSTSGMAYFDIAKKTLPAVGLDCPIWLVGIKD